MRRIERYIRLHLEQRSGEICHGLVVASPEYNGQLTPFLKNLVDWVSRLSYTSSRFEPVFCDRPVLLCSASTGWSGGAVGLPHARSLFGYVGSVVVGDAITLPFADQAWDADGEFLDPELQLRIDGATARILHLARGYRHLRPAAAQAA